MVTIEMIVMRNAMTQFQRKCYSTMHEAHVAGKNLKLKRNFRNEPRCFMNENHATMGRAQAI